MGVEWKADGLVTEHSNNVDRYKRNFLRQVVCELRFPTVIELGDPAPPASLVKALRMEYPHLELTNEVTLGVGGGLPGSNNAHVFRSSKYTWAVSIKQSSLTVETTSYVDFADFKSRVSTVVAAASKIIDTDFFTRIGVRYINVIDSGFDPREGWINGELLSPLLSARFGGIHEYAGRMHLSADDGGCILQHGLRIKPPYRGQEVAPEYTLDIDSYRNEIAITDAVAALTAMHAQAFDIFDWAIGERSREHLSALKPIIKG